MQFLVVTNLGQAQWLCQEPKFMLFLEVTNLVQAHRSLRSRPRSAKSQDYAVSCSYKPGTSPVALARAKIHAVS